MKLLFTILLTLGFTQAGYANQSQHKQSMSDKSNERLLQLQEKKASGEISEEKYNKKIEKMKKRQEKRLNRKGNKAERKAKREARKEARRLRKEGKSN